MLELMPILEVKLSGSLKINKTRTMFPAKKYSFFFLLKYELYPFVVVFGLLQMYIQLKVCSRNSDALYK